MDSYLDIIQFTITEVEYVQEGWEPRRFRAPRGARTNSKGRFPAINLGKAALNRVYLVPLSLTVGRSLLQAERSGSESRRGCRDRN